MDKKGNRIKGQSIGPNADFIKLALRKQGINPIAVRKASTLFAKGKGTIESGDIAIFSRQMATMLASGVPLVQALEIIGRGHDKPAMGEMVMGIKTHIEGGASFAEALGKYPLHFDDLFVNLVDAGEKSGALETLLDKIATYKEKTEALKKKVKKALTYPIAVLVVAFIVTGILLSLARVMGETAPLLILVGYSTSINFDMFGGFQGSLPGMMFDQVSAGAGANPVPTDRLWGAALTLVLLIALLNVGARFIAKFFAPKKV
nr:type II secretion system F family protein [Mycolicibacterium poriferae]